MSVTLQQIRVDLLRRTMPMTAYWHIMQATRHAIAVASLPLNMSAAMVEVMAESLKVMADCLQERFIYRKEDQ